MRKIAIISLFAGLALAVKSVAAEPEPFAESAHVAHGMLTRLCDDFGGRLTGSVNDRGAMHRLAEELRALGLQPEIRPFKMAGWVRGEDKVEMLEPVARTMRVAAIAYTQPHAAFEADVADIGAGKPADYPADVRGKVLLLSPSTALSTGENARYAAERGAKGILFINREGGGQLLARTGNFSGEPLPLPVYSITQEEGFWMQRRLARGKPVRVRLETKSHCAEIDTANLAVVLKGRSPERMVVGAHFDSWDLGQGALDNGLGTAQLFALAHALRGRELARTVELIWFNGEEQGLRGSRHAAAALGETPVVAMINLDMVGVPIAVNALGDESLVPALTRWNTGRGERKLPRGVENINWFGSDHTPYQLAGVRAITFNAPIPRESVRYYHDFADTMDKLPEKIVVESTAIIGDLLLALVNDGELAAWRRPPADTEKLFTTFGLDVRMKKSGLWPFETKAKP